MNCHRFRKLADDYLDMTLSGRQLQAFLGHEKVCGACRAYLKDRKMTVRLLSETCDDIPEVDITDDVMEVISRIPLPKKPSSFRLPLLIAVSTAILTGLFMLWFGLSGIPAELSRMDVIKTISSLFDLPEDVRNGLMQIKALFQAFLLVASTFLRLLKELVRHLGTPVLVAGASLGVLMSFAAWLLWSRMRNKAWRVYRRIR